MILNLLHRKSELMAKTDPNRIYVENVRSFFHVPHSVAKFFCEMAVKEGYFKKKTAIVCPNNSCGRVIKSVDSIDNDIFKCKNCEMNEEIQCEFDIDSVKKIEFYQLNRK